jgi:hypothetical protein
VTRGRPGRRQPWAGGCGRSALRAPATIGRPAPLAARAVPALARALADPDAEVGKAPVLALTRRYGTAEARAALAAVTSAPDADIRAYTARGL